MLKKPSSIVGRRFTFKIKLVDYNLDQGKESLTVADICDKDSTNDNHYNEIKRHTTSFVASMSIEVGLMMGSIRLFYVSLQCFDLAS
ncbi:hypothetical protein Syun_019284 [Stephania yunnanensis]|uniref:Uncharacterized protein n=1 Tax=Stephania yunnanensis TaxID=152371 RepID=A0AAP0IVT4_9MAGN